MLHTKILVNAVIDEHHFLRKKVVCRSPSTGEFYRTMCWIDGKIVTNTEFIKTLRKMGMDYP